MSDASLLDIMRRYPQGIAVVTATGADGPRGITVSSFLSVSLDPPLVLASIMKEARAHEAIDRGGFVVNVLAEDQGFLSDRFSRSNLSPEEQFRDVTAEGDPPVIDGCLGYLHCRVMERISVADHTLFVGEVQKAELGRGGKPLVFFDRQYWSLGTTVYRRD